MKIPHFRTKPNGVPILSAAEINQIAEQIVRELQPELFDHQIDAVNLSALMKNLTGWHYAGRWLSRSGSLLGATIFQAGTSLITDEQRREIIPMQVPAHTILIDRGLYRKENEKIFRFTLGHEIGHALLHEAFSYRKENMQNYKNQSKERLLEDRAIMFGIREHRQLRSDYDWIEWQANAFSSALLMPEMLVLQVRDLVVADAVSDIKGNVDKPDAMSGTGENVHARGQTSQRRLENESGKTSGPSDMMSLNELCITLMDVFRVSHTAVFYRMKELGILPENCRRLPNGLIV